MTYLFWILNYLYGGAMLVAIFSVRQTSPTWLTLLNLCACSLLFATPKSPLFLYSGLSLLILAACLNGYVIFGKITPQHLIVRLIFSLVLILLDHLFI